MKREPLLTLLDDYTIRYPLEREMAEQVAAFVRKYENCFERSLLCGHITASGWIVNPGLTHAILIHHAKLDKWLQPGGHCDGDTDVLRVAQKEVFEETGLDAKPLTENIFDVDIHAIPERRDVPPHLHYDIRFLLAAEKKADNLPPNRETKETRWIPIESIDKFTGEPSITRMLAKTVSYKQTQPHTGARR